MNILKSALISGALRDAIHETTGFSSHFVVFGQHKITHGNQYKILKKLNLLSDNNVHLLSASDRLNSIKSTIKENFSKAYAQNQKTYNLRSCVRNIQPSQ